MAIEIKQVKTRKDIKAFIFLPEKIHAGRANWVPPIYMDERKYFDPKKNKAFGYCETVLLLAFRGNDLVGRVMGIINNRFNEYRKVRIARFGDLEAREDPEVVHALLDRVEEWARGKGMNRVIGPYGLRTRQDENRKTVCAPLTRDRVNTLA
jgi:hypothetical protein